MAEYQDPLADEQIKIYDDLVSKRRQVADNDWQYIAQYALPQDSNITTQKTPSVSGWTDQIYETTLIRSIEVLASGMYNWWTPQGQPWAEYDLREEQKVQLRGNSGGDENPGDDSATIFLAKASDRAMKELGRSNFYMAKATSDIGLAAFATDLMLVDESDTGNELFNFIHVKIGTYVIEENYKGIVDTVRREVEMTYRQIKQKFNKPGDVIPERMARMAKGASGNKKKFKIVHCIFPREDSKRLPGARDGKNKPFASVYIAYDFKETMRVSGYDETPILCRRFKKWVTPYGYGPAYIALPEARQINYMQQFLDSAAEMHLYPRTLIPSSLEGDVDLRAGGVTVYDENEAGAKPEEWGTVSDYKLGLDLLEKKKEAIRDACFVDAFKLLNSAPLLDKEMTAYEISQRQAEQLQNMTPLDARTVIEFINPLMTRVFGIMLRANKLGTPPDSLLQDKGDGKKQMIMPEIVVTSRFNDAMRALKNRGIEETFKFLMPIVENMQKPEILDNYDLDKIARGYGRNAAVSPDDLRPMKGPNSVAMIRAQRKQMMDAQRAAAMAEQMGKAGAGLGRSPQFVQDQAEQALTGGKKNRNAA
jgi:Bacteriophage head to tail connecting protein